MQERVLQFIRRLGLLRPGDRVAVAASGGGDSMVLLDLLAGLRPRLGITLTVAHYNHRLRGDESDEDERSVRQLAESLNLPFLVDYARDLTPGTRNLEARARELRYAFLAGLVESGTATKVATGHTADDQAETVVGRFLRGGGTAGLAGIYPQRDEWLIRPLLEERRDAVRAWATARGLAWREDSSNADPRFLRNRLRRDLLPLLESEFNPNLVEVMSDAATVARAEEDYWQRHIQELARALQPLENGVWKLSLADFVQYHEAQQRRLLREALRRVRGHLRGVDFRHVEQARRLALEGQSGRAVELPGGHVERDLDALVFRAGPAPSVSGFEVPVQVPGACEIPQIGRRLVFKLVPGGAEGAGYNQRRGECLIALDAVQQPLLVRNWRPGDSWETSPGKRRKLKSLLLERRIPREQRQIWPVVASGEQLIWARGFSAPPSCRWTKGRGTGLRIVEEELGHHGSAANPSG